MPTEALNCPNCGAPLYAQPGRAVWLCLYCNSLVRVGEHPAQESASVEQTLSDEVMGQVKQLVISGRRQPALDLYRQVAGADDAAAAQVIDDISRQFSLQNIRQQQLTPYGWLVVSLFSLALLVCLLAWWRAVLPGWLAGILVAFFGWNLFFYSAALRTSLRFLRASKVRASVLNYTLIGKLGSARRMVYSFKLLVRLHPPQQEPFVAEMYLAVRESKLSSMRAGLEFWVKYLPGDPPELIFDRMVEAE